MYCFITVEGFTRAALRLLIVTMNRRGSTFNPFTVVALFAGTGWGVNPWDLSGVTVFDKSSVLTTVLSALKVNGYTSPHDCRRHYALAPWTLPAAPPTYTSHHSTG